MITLVQTLWFSAGIIQRVCVHLPLTTLELTASSFALVMFATSAAWYHKPYISRPRYFSLEDSQTVQSVRDFSQRHVIGPALGKSERTHRWQLLSDPLHVTWSMVSDLEYLSQERFGINFHWSYYTRLGHMLHVRIFSRSVSSRPWDRFHSDLWLCLSSAWIFPAFLIAVIFSISFIAGWDCYFPTFTEIIMWRVFCIYHAAFSISGAIHNVVEMLRSKNLPSHSSHSRRNVPPIEGNHRDFPQTWENWFQIPIAARFLEKWCATLPNQDLDARIPLRILIPITIISAFYTISRLLLYIEDFISFREQPSGV